MVFYFLFKPRCKIEGVNILFLLRLLSVIGSTNPVSYCGGYLLSYGCHIIPTGFWIRTIPFSGLKALCRNFNTNAFHNNFMVCFCYSWIRAHSLALAEAFSSSSL
jgi:hypothetical protein